MNHKILLKDDSLILTPMQTKDSFLEELEEAEKDWKKNGGKDLKAMKKKYKLK